MHLTRLTKLVNSPEQKGIGISPDRLQGGGCHLQFISASAIGIKV